MSAPSTAVSHRAPALPPDERRAAIITAVHPLLIEHGERVTTRQIAEAAGIAEGTIFRVFADKDELLGATLEAALDTSAMEEAIEAIDRRLPFEQQVVEAIEIIHRRVVDVWRLVSNLGPRFHSRISRPTADSDALTALFAAEADGLTVDPPVAARMLRGLTLSMTHPMLADEVPSAPEIAAVLLHGIERAR